MYGVSRSVILLIAMTCVGHASMSKAAGPKGAPPGVIIYLRDVPTREAQAYAPPGTAHFVAAAPQEIVTGLLTSSLTPLSDEAAGNVSAGTGGAIAKSLGFIANGGAALDAFNTLGATKAEGGGQFGSELATVTMQATSPIGSLIGSALASATIPSVGH